MRKSLSEVDAELKEAGFAYLGSCIICDCYHHFWVKQLSDDKYLLAISDGWLEDYTPKFYDADEEDVQRVKKKIREFHEWK